MDTLAHLFKALADPSRLRMLNLLLHARELCVCDIEAVMGFTQTKVSRHLGYLKRARLVDNRRQGLWVFYSVARPVDAERRALLVVLRSVLRDLPIAQRDAQRLSVQIARGHCATFSRKPAAGAAARVPGALPRPIPHTMHSPRRLTTQRSNS